MNLSPDNTAAKLFVCLAIILATLATYWQVFDHGFINFDDNVYITDNLNVSQGLTLENIVWAFDINTKLFYWQPVTLLSHMLDVQLFGLKPGLHHLVNVLIHIVNSILIFTLLSKLTGQVWNSAFVALLFALHPINVESVAWIAERKNVLSTFFWLLTMLAYVRYAAKQTLTSYLTTFLAFGLGVLVKPMLVTLPFTLLLLDYWPLNRLALAQQSNTNPQLKIVPANFRRLLLEKLPLLMLALTIALLVSNTTKTISLETVPMGLRLANAVASYWHYLANMIMPVNLAMYYLYPTELIVWSTVATGLWLLCTTTIILRTYQTRPYLTMGWLWYLGTLVPVLGLIQSGFWPAFADRWGYVPLIGLYIMIAWGAPEIIRNWRYRKTLTTFAAIIILAALMAGSRHQIQYWTDEIALYKHTIDVGAGHPLLYNNLGAALENKNRTDEAIFYYQAALQQSNEYSGAHNNLAVALAKLNRPEEAIAHFREALRLEPDYLDATENLELVLIEQQRIAEEISNYRQALKADPDSVELYNQIGKAHAKSGQIDEAVECYTTAIEKDPDYKESYNNLAAVLLSQGYRDEAITFLEKALKIDPEYVEARKNLAIAARTPAGENIY